MVISQHLENSRAHIERVSKICRRRDQVIDRRDIRIADRSGKKIAAGFSNLIPGGRARGEVAADI